MERKQTKKYILKKYCECCNNWITRQNFTTHKNTVKHINNKLKYKPINLLDAEKDINHDINYFKLQLEEIKNNIENILKNVN